MYSEKESNKTKTDFISLNSKDLVCLVQAKNKQ